MARPITTGDLVECLSEGWLGHWGRVVKADPGNDEYHVSGGSIGEIAPVFYRDELRLRPARPAALCVTCGGIGQCDRGHGMAQCPACFGTGNPRGVR